MATWQIALLLLALVWGLQSLGVWMQMRHYGKVIREIRESEKDGFLGTGHVRGRFSKGTIAVVVASADGIVRKVSIMTGRSSLATFRERPELAGRPLTAFTTDAPGLPALTDGEQEAIRKAIGQIEQVRQKRGIEALTYDQANAQTA